MSKLIDKATGHFESVLAQGLKGPIAVAEWDAEIYYKPATTMYEESKIIELTQAGKTTEALVQTLIMRARDKDGNLVFDGADKPKLMRAVDPAVILRIVTSMNTDAAAAEEALGN
jgi:hypothetical protein